MTSLDCYQAQSFAFVNFDPHFVVILNLMLLSGSHLKMSAIFRIRSIQNFMKRIILSCV